MKKTKVEVSDFEPTPQVLLTAKAGQKLVGFLQKKVPNKTFPDKMNYLVEVEDTDAPTAIYNKETEKLEEVDIEQGANVWLNGTTVLDQAFKVIEPGQKIEVVYTGKGKAKPGRKAPYQFDVYKVEE